jgi:putative SOS response-associated peptidase YedK
MGVQADFAFGPRYNIAPTQNAWIVAEKEGSLELKQARWGLIPFWAKDEKIGNKLINARSETIAFKPAFRAPFKKRRCLVLADGFFEWKKTAEGKQPTYIRMREGRQFAFGGIWERWTNPDGVDLETFSIITVEPNELCSAVHDRMPLILREGDFPAWLDTKTSPRILPDFLRPCAAAEMELFPVSTLVNSPKNEDSKCVERV